MNKLSNIFLINMPHLNDDPVFGQSLIYICEHNDKGAMGLIINKPLHKEESLDIIKQIGLTKQMVYFGGPVSPEKGFILHDINYQKDETLIISNTAGISYSDEVLDDIKNGLGPNEYRIVMGYSGWESGQLEKEIENGDWIIMPSSKELIFSQTDKNKWNIAIKNMNINFNDFSGKSGLA